MNKLVALGLGSMLFSTATLADTPPENLITMDGDDDIIQLSAPSSKSNQQNRGPRRTNFFSGMEIEETVYDSNPKVTSTRFIIADGSTRFHQNFRMRYVLSEVHNKEGNPRRDRGTRVNYTLAPRYEKWVSPRFSYFAEPVFMRRVEADGSENQEIKLKPGGQFTYGKHFFNGTAEYKMITRERYKTDQNGWGKESAEKVDFDAWNAEVNYTYRYSQKLNYGMAIIANRTFDNSYDARNTRSSNYSIRPFVRLRHWNDITSEFNVKPGRSKSGPDWTGHDYIDVNLNNNMPLNRNVRLVANFGYRYGEEHTSNQHSWGDREGVFMRLGANFSF